MSQNIDQLSRDLLALTQKVALLEGSLRTGTNRLRPHVVHGPGLPEREKLFIDYDVYQIQSNTGGGVSLAAYIDKAFDSGQSGLIKSSLGYIVTDFWANTFPRFQNKIMNGNYDHTRDENAPFPASTDGMLKSPPGSDPKWAETWKVDVAMAAATGADRNPGRQQEYRTLYITRYEKSEPAGSTSFELGHAALQQYWNARDLNISLNGTYLNVTTQFPKGNNQQTWASIILHEIMHNLGWDHGPDQRGSVIQALQDAAENLPSDSFTLTG